MAETVFGGNKTAYDVAEVALDITVMGIFGVATDNKYTRIKTPIIFKGHGGRGFKPTTKTMVLYANPNAEGGPGGTFFAYKGGTKFRIDWDPAHSLHGHWGVGKAAQKIHRGIYPWNWGQDLDK
ncbi:hypothetical protein OXPF_37360 [Oxobacter pfennigii]|uniref:Uncharacterized protein n=1 Tax=Oxobacter pfennigii TaxID=36849 RepID=A0A0P9ACZ5_9CLOT|nr:hypothetical protein [Oxobacter pfennigii]KPU42967.1 hypothetical protein OXPF_37360 [Oxobacter pfennigii]